MNHDEKKERREDMLRRKAEKLFEKMETETRDNYPSDEVKRLLQELQIYQIELEMQNEQLRATTQELQESQEKFENLYQFAPVGYITLNESGLVTEANTMAVNIWNRENTCSGLLPSS